MFDGVDLQQLFLQLDAFVIFRSLLKDPALALLARLVQQSQDLSEQLRNYADFVAALYAKTDDFSLYLLNLALEDENIYMLKKSQNRPVSPELSACLQYELQTLQALSSVTGAQVRQLIGYDGFLPIWRNSSVNFAAAYQKRVEQVSHYGYGIFAKHHMFMIRKSAVTPVQHPDTIQLSQLIGYEPQRKIVVDNTLALLHNKPAQNILLYGDAGTGKSSTVKAVVNRYKEDGLRLIQIAKKQLRDIPSVIDALSQNPLKFILFIDDLSFSENDDDFSALKAILEGSVSARTSNIVIYATSNRRHMIKENFADRQGSELHENDTIQELISLSERFGLTVSFMKPGRDEYLEIVKGLAAQYHLLMPQDRLILEAEQFALHHSGRSARTARQFIEYALSRVEEQTGR